MLPAILGVLTLFSVVLLLAWDVFPGLFASGAHSLFGALPLALIALAYLVYQTVRRPERAEAFKAVLLAIAFLFWAANQFWPGSLRSRYIFAEAHPEVSAPPWSLLLQFFCDQLVKQRRVGLAFRGPHHLAHEESRHGLLAAAILLKLFGVGLDDLVDQGFEG